jgi:hypothetical protein
MLTGRVLSLAAGWWERQALRSQTELYLGFNDSLEKLCERLLCPSVFPHRLPPVGHRGLIISPTRSHLVSKSYSLSLGFLWIQKRYLEFQLPGGRRQIVRTLDVSVGLDAEVYWLKANLIILPIPPPNGTSQTLPLGAFPSSWR